MEKEIPEIEEHKQDDRYLVDKAPIALPPSDLGVIDMAKKPSKFVRLCPSENLPSLAERKKHMLTHLPHATWCNHCVEGRMVKDHALT